MPYARFAQMVTGTAGGEAPIAEGQTLSFQVTAGRGGKPLEGARMFLGEQELSGQHGRFDVPYSRELVARNPSLRMVPPPGYRGALAFEVGITLHKACGEERAAPPKRADLTGWHTHDVGPDRIYVEPPLTIADASHLEHLLVEARSMLAELTGTSPPPLAIAVMQDDAPNRYATRDPDQRVVWLTRVSRSREEAFAGFIAHEWTHGLLDEIGFPDDTQLRYIEDGLADLLGHVLERRMLDREVTPILETHRQQLAQMPDERVDLFAIANKYAGEQTIAGSVEAMCRSGASRGYALGMAYWFGRTDGHAGAIRAQFDLWQRAMPSDAEAMVQSLSVNGVSPRAFSVARARDWLLTREPSTPSP